MDEKSEAENVDPVGIGEVEGGLADVDDAFIPDEGLVDEKLFALNEEAMLDITELFWDGLNPVIVGFKAPSIPVG